MKVNYVCITNYFHRGICDAHVGKYYAENDDGGDDISDDDEDDALDNANQPLQHAAQNFVVRNHLVNTVFQRWYIGDQYIAVIWSQNEINHVNSQNKYSFCKKWNKTASVSAS